MPKQSILRPQVIHAMTPEGSENTSQQKTAKEGCSNSAGACTRTDGYGAARIPSDGAPGLHPAKKDRQAVVRIPSEGVPGSLTRESEKWRRGYPTRIPRLTHQRSSNSKGICQVPAQPRGLWGLPEHCTALAFSRCSSMLRAWNSRPVSSAAELPDRKAMPPQSPSRCAAPRRPLSRNPIFSSASVFGRGGSKRLLDLGAHGPSLTFERLKRFKHSTIHRTLQCMLIEA